MRRKVVASLAWSALMAAGLAWSGAALAADGAAAGGGSRRWSAAG